MTQEKKRIVTKKATNKLDKIKNKGSVSINNSSSIFPRVAVDKMDYDKEEMSKRHQEYVDLCRLFVLVFDNDNGKKMLDYLDKYSHKNFPNYDNVNATYSKIGEQTLVGYIRGMVYKAKTGGE